jgi:hypothetical protein
MNVQTCNNLLTDLFWFAIRVRRSLSELIWIGMLPPTASIFSLGSFASVDPVIAYSNRRRRISRASMDEFEEAILQTPHARGCW